MWLVTQHGFFNIIEQDDDREKGLLTIKARRREDLEEIQICNVWFSDFKIEQSDITDYKFRMKAPRQMIENLISTFLDEINYDKTKVRLNEKHPDRSGIYFNVWDTLCELQSETKTYTLKD